MNWTLFDFAFFGAMVAAVVIPMWYTLRRRPDRAYRTGVALALAGAFLLVWLNGAVGIIGNETNDANLMYLGLLGVGIAGAVFMRGRPPALQLTLKLMAAAQVLIGVVAVAGGLGVGDPSWPWDVVFLTGFFTGLWLLSAAFFGRSARPA